VINGLSHDPGSGMVAGLCILLLAIVIDRITQAMGQGTRGGGARAGRIRSRLAQPRDRVALVSPDMSAATVDATGIEREGDA
jgi:hypothetical protein